LKWGCYATFCFMKDKIASPYSILSDLAPLSLEIEIEDDWGCPNPSNFDRVLTEDPNQGYVKM